MVLRGYRGCLYPPWLPPPRLPPPSRVPFYTRAHAHTRTRTRAHTRAHKHTDTHIYLANIRARGKVEVDELLVAKEHRARSREANHLASLRDSDSKL